MIELYEHKIKKIHTIHEVIVQSAYKQRTHLIGEGGRQTCTSKNRTTNSCLDFNS